jgi:hypothetical protein
MMNQPTSTSDRRDRLVFYPVAVVGGLFCLSIFICIAATFGDPEVPVNRWINRHFSMILLGEAVLLVVVCIGAMTIDRLRFLHQQDSESPAGTRNEAAPEGTADHVD